MSAKISNDIKKKHIVRAIEKLEAKVEHKFERSTGYDVLYKNKRYPPKAVVGIASKEVNGIELFPGDFSGGLNTKCFRILEKNGFKIVTKGDTRPWPSELDEHSRYTEGTRKRVWVNRFERDKDARKKCLEYYGYNCCVCGFNFKKKYGELGENFIHVHHLIPLSKIKKQYVVDPIKDLIPVCPNCHAMLHKTDPPFTVDELKEII